MAALHSASTRNLSAQGARRSVVANSLAGGTGRVEARGVNAIRRTPDEGKRPSRGEVSATSSTLISPTRLRSECRLSNRDASLGECTFSADQNPFLYPLSLLDSLASPSEGIATSSDEADVSSDLQPGWWLLHTKPRQEKKLAGQLAAYGVSHYLPTTKRRAVTRGRTRVTQSPLFPSYFFLYGTPDERLRALETNRLVAAHRVDDSQELSQRLWELAELIEVGAPLTAEARLAVGRKVRVKAGPFSGTEGTVAMRGGKTRLFISVNELLGGVSLEVEEHLLEPVL